MYFFPLSPFPSPSIFIRGLISFLFNFRRAIIVISAPQIMKYIIQYTLLVFYYENDCILGFET